MYELLVMVMRAREVIMFRLLAVGFAVLLVVVDTGFGPVGFDGALTRDVDVCEPVRAGALVCG